MYAIFEDGGRQYKVSAGDKVYVDLRDLNEGQDTIEFDRILMLGEGAESKIGQPFVDGAKVVGKLHGEIKGKKVVGVDFRRRKNVRVKYGHRQRHLEVTIAEIVQ